MPCASPRRLARPARAERVYRAQQRRADAMAVPADALRRQRLRRTRRMASLLMVGATAARTRPDLADGDHRGRARILGRAGRVALAARRRRDRACSAASTPGRCRARAAPARTRSSSPLPRELPVRRPIDPAPWTPVPVPQPLYLSKPPVQRMTPAVDAGTLLRQAAAQQEEAERDARPAAPVVPLRADPPAAARANRYAGMGILDPGRQRRHRPRRGAAPPSQRRTDRDSLDAHQEYDEPGLPDGALDADPIVAVRGLAAGCRGRRPARPERDGGRHDRAGRTSQLAHRAAEGSRRRRSSRSSPIATRTRARRSRTSRGCRCCSPGTGCTGRCGSRGPRSSRPRPSATRTGRPARAGRSSGRGRAPSRSRSRAGQTWTPGRRRSTPGSTGSRPCRARRTGADIW